MLQPKYLAKAVAKINSDKRDTDRVKSVFSGIVMSDGEFRCHCIIRDVSNTGMKLEFQDTKDIPDEFEIKTPALPGTLQVRRVWKKHNSMGVTFVDITGVDENGEEISE